VETPYDPLTPEAEARIFSFRARGYVPAEIAMILRLPHSVVRALLYGPQWPKLVTRIHTDGSWEIVRHK
jgi:hypothetical protein